ncbi:hypothetical protein C4D60_Mb07t15850 [Musa balbisiana]|uniref:Sodium/calcium exchanger membrane region domain-containing protein n=1 Tax=Musa balbisiana TaxID=52838 RepID=A0A4S8JI37_MUSBA|nr:hypothetical protein C4D60_Mb07t15850 [Musa balbisiana]
MAHRHRHRPDAFVFSLLVLLLSGRCVDGRAISPLSDGDALELPASDGISGYGVAGYKHSPLLVLPRGSAAEACEPSYGFLPCTTTVAGNLFLVLVYGFLMYKAATCLSAGSEMLLEILGPGIVGGLFLPILGALPDALLILGRSFLAFLFLWSSSL